MDKLPSEWFFRTVMGTSLGMFYCPYIENIVQRRNFLLTEVLHPIIAFQPCFSMVRNLVKVFPGEIVEQLRIAILVGFYLVQRKGETFIHDHSVINFAIPSGSKER